MPNVPRRIFLPWDSPFLPQAVSWLAGDWTGPEALDLSSVAVVVPTRQAGRRLREALALHAAGRDAAVFSPRVFTADALLAEAQGDGSPERLSRTLAWVEVLQAIDLAEFREVFAVDPPLRNFGWALRLAEQLVRVQRTLAENALTIRHVPNLVGAAFPEFARWVQLAELEQRHADRLEKAGFTPAAIVDADRFMHALAGTQRLVLLGVPDPVPTLLTALGALRDLAVETAIFAPETCAALFDGWGRPQASAWAGREIALPNFEQHVHGCVDPAEQAARIVQLVTAYGAERADGALEVGITDPEVTHALESAGADAGVSVFNPEGTPQRMGALYHLLRAIAFTSADPTFAEIETLARMPEFLAHAARSLGSDFSAAAFLADLDRLKQDHLPASLKDARAHASSTVATVLELIAEIARLARQPFPKSFGEILTHLFAGRTLTPAAEDLELQEAARTWAGLIADIAVVAVHFPEFGSAEYRELAIRLFADLRLARDRPAGALELQGWLELLFADAPHLVLAGFNDGFAPEAIAEDPFLPDALRRRLGLRTNGERFARDAFLLTAIVNSRAAQGRVDLLFGKSSEAGDPLRPSRLLLRCSDEALAPRVMYLFRTPERQQAEVAWTRAWQLHPRRASPPHQVAVTALRRWLTCRFRFYLKYALRMDTVDAAKGEMDAFDFGRLCHTALEAMGRDRTLCECTDAALLREFLVEKLAAVAREKFGSALTLPLVIQVESARQRLAKFAEIQAQTRADGWIIQEVERPITTTICGLTIRGQVDRIDRHEHTGAVRVLDYKTSDAGVAPPVAHLRPWRDDAAWPEWARVIVEGRPRGWADLQLPLYRHALAAEFGSDIGVGYITLPKATSETSLALWDDYTSELHSAAMRCADGVCTAIMRGEFWPPNEEIRAENDEFAALFHEGVAASVEWVSGKNET